MRRAKEKNKGGVWSVFLALRTPPFALAQWSCRGSNPGPDMACNMPSTCLAFLEFRRCKVKSLPVTQPELRIWVSEFSQSHCFPSLYVRRPNRTPVRRKCSGTMTMLIPRIKQPLRKNSCHLRHLQISLTGTPAKPGMLTYPTPSRQIHVSPNFNDQSRISRDK